MTHDTIIGHCGYVGEFEGWLDVVEDGEVVAKIPKGSRGAVMIVYSTAGMPHKQLKWLERTIDLARARIYHGMSVDGEPIHYEPPGDGGT